MGGTPINLGTGASKRRRGCGAAGSAGACLNWETGRGADLSVRVGLSVSVWAERPTIHGSEPRRGEEAAEQPD